MKTHLLVIRFLFLTVLFFTSGNLLAQEPTTPSFNLNFSNINGDQMYMFFNSGNGAKRIIIAKEGSSVTAIPSDGIDYVASTTFGNGNELAPGEFVVYEGSGSATWIYGLDHSKTYHFRIYEFNGSNTLTDYLTTSFLEGSQSTLTNPTTQASNITFSNVDGNSMTVNWVNGNGNGRILIAKEGSPVDVEPQQLIDYSASSSFGQSWTEIGSTGNFVLYESSGSSDFISNLQPGTTYHFALFEYNGSGNGKVFLTSTSIPSIPGTTASQTTLNRPTENTTALSFSNINSNEMYVFTSNSNFGNGARRIVVAKEGSPVTGFPADGTDYNSDSTLGNGDTIGTDEYVVYDGTGLGTWVYGLQPGTTYHFKVFEYDGTGANISYLIGPDSNSDPVFESSQSTLSNPTTQASNITFSNVDGNSMTVNWTNGDGSGRILIAKEGSPVDVEPQDFTDYSASSSFGQSWTEIGDTGNYVLYDSSGSSDDVSNLQPGVTYHFAVFEFSGSSNSKIYLTSTSTPNSATPAIASQTTATAPTENTTALSFSNINSNQMYVFASNSNFGNGARRIVVAKEGSPVTGSPVDGTDYDSDSTLGNGDTLGTDEYVVYDGTGLGTWVYGLQPGTTYHFKVFEYNGTGANTSYLIGPDSNSDPVFESSQSTLSNPTTQASNITFSNVDGNSMTVNWTNGDGSGRILIAKEGSPVDVEPQDFTDYSASSSFGQSWTEIGDTGNYVLYDSSGSSDDVSNLQPGVTYHFAVFEFSGSSNSKIYLTSTSTPNSATPAIASQTTATAPTENTTALSFSNLNSNQMYVFASNSNFGNGARRIVVAKEGSPVTGSPVDGTDYDSDSTLGNGDTLGTDEYVVYDGTGLGTWVYGLQPGTTYHFKVFEYNGTGSNTFYLTGPDSNSDPVFESSQATIGTPTVNSTGVFFNSKTNTSFNLNWTNGNGSGRLLVAREGSPVNVEPQDLIDYSSSTSFGQSWTEIGSGNYAIYDGSGNSVNVSNLNSGTNYHFELFEFNGSGGGKVYLRPGYTFEEQTFGTTPTLQVSNPLFSVITSSSMVVDFDKGDGSHRLVLARKDNPINVSPMDLTSYNASNLFGNGDEIGTGNFVVFSDTGEEFQLTNLDPTSTYHFAFFEYALSQDGNLYLTPGLTASQTTSSLPCQIPSNLNVTNITNSAATLSWDTEATALLGYEYVLNTDGTVPDGSTTPDGSVGTGVNTLDLTTLLPNTEYFFFVRSVCEENNQSQWSNFVNFTTLCDEPVALTQDILVQLDASGQVTITPEQVDAGSTSNCGSNTLSLDITEFDCADIGANTVTLTVTDVNDNTATETAIVTVEDITSPTVITQNITIQLDASGQATIAPSDIDNGSSDNCGIDTLSIDLTSFTSSDLGPNIVTLTVTDVNGNINTGQATVTVEEFDTNLIFNGSAEIVPVIGNGWTQVQGNTTGTDHTTPFDGNNHFFANQSALAEFYQDVDLSAYITEIDNGNQSFSFSFYARSFNQSPTDKGRAIVEYRDQSGNILDTYDSGLISSVDVWTLVEDTRLAPIGSRTVRVRIIQDRDAGTNNDAYIDKIVFEEAQNVDLPVVVTQDITVPLDANGQVTIVPSDVDDGSTSSGTTSLSLDITDFDCSDVGPNTVTLTVSDGLGNSETGTAVVTVEDNLAPVAVAQNLTVEIDENGQGVLMANMVDNGSTDNCGIASVSIDKMTFSCSDIGVEVVTLTVTDVNGNSSTATSNITVEDQNPPNIWYADNDLDGFGNENDFIEQCSQPAGYVAEAGDCNDDDPDLYPGAQYFDFTGNTGFVDTVVNPTSGAPTDTYTFEVNYFDINNEMPPFGFPRAIVDFNSDNNFTGSNDRTVILSPLDPSDTDLTDGKTYVGSITPLEAHLDYQVIIQSTVQGCETLFGPFDAPDVLEQSDVEIFASDISFSEDNPEVNSPLTVTAEVHNVSDLPAEDFFVGLQNQFDNTVYSDVFVDFIAPNSSAIVEWTITTPAVDAFVPMQVIIDKTDVIAESNELDNTAVRPFINGDFNVPGSIDVVQSVSPPSGFTYTQYRISGVANYSDLAVELDDPTVKGAEVSIFVPELGQTFQGNTNNAGSFNIKIPTGDYIAPGDYNYEGTITDFTLTSEQFNGQFTVSPGPLDLRASVVFMPNEILDDGSSTSSVFITVENISFQDASATNLSISQSPGFTSIPENVTIPPLLAGESHSISFSDLSFTGIGTYSVSVQADSDNILAESNENNNFATGTIEVLVPKPDLVFSNGPQGNLLLCQNNGQNISFGIRNVGNVPSTNSFTTSVDVYRDGVFQNTYQEVFNGSISVNGVGSVSIPNPYDDIGNYSFVVTIDTLGNVDELSEGNNSGGSSINVTECKPDLTVSVCHNSGLIVSPEDPLDQANVAYSAEIRNNGQIANQSSFVVLFEVDGPGGTTSYTQVFNGTLNPASSTVVSVSAPLAPQDSNLTVTVDANDEIDENNENNNLSNSIDLCHEFSLRPPINTNGNQFWNDNTFFQFENVVPNIRLIASNAYTASEVDVKFEVSGPGIPGTIDLGTVTIDDVNQCDMPNGGYGVVLPTSFSFNELGSYTFTFTVDPDNEYLECDDTNNVFTRDVEVESLADMQTLSEFINPSILNPDVNEEVTLNITYENLGFQNVSDEMDLKIFVNEVELATVENVPGLLNGDNNTVTVPVPFQSNIPGANVVKVFIDSEDEIVELREDNNEATRVIIVGDASNLFFEDLLAINLGSNNQIQLEAIVGNDGILDTEAELRFTYLTPAGYEILIGQMPIQLDADSTESYFMNWTTTNPNAVVKAEIINSTVPEFNELDNIIELENRVDFGLSNPNPLNLVASGGDNVDIFVDVNADFTTIPFAVNNVQLSAYLSSDCELDVNTDQLLGTTSVDFAVDQSTVTSSINANLPAVVDDNSRIIWVVDSNEQFEESDEDNNELCITVNSDNTVPPTVVTQNITVDLDGNGIATITPDDIDNGSSDDATPNVDLIRTLDIDTFDCGDIGANTVTLTVTDSNGNSSSGTATVTVEDNLDPTAIAEDFTVSLNAVGQATISASDIGSESYDNCSIVSLELDVTSFDCSNLGENTVTLTVIDTSGNTSTDTAIVTVEDNIAPLAVAQDITVSLGSDGTVTITPDQLESDSTDNCGIAAYELDQMTFDSSDLGANTVTLTVTDTSGNQDTDTAVVTVEAGDSSLPFAIAQDMTVQLDANGEATITPAMVDNGSTADAGIASLSLDITEFDCSNLGPNTVTLTVTDVNGESDSATAVVTVEDNISPVVFVQDISVQLDANGNAVISASDVDEGSFDNCGIVSSVLDITTFDCSNLGANNVTLTVTDASGNDTSETAIVTVEDNVTPTVMTQDITVQLDGSGNASITPAMIDDGSFDNCEIESYSLDVTDFTTSDIGPNTVTLTVTDVNGNSSLATAVVTVLEQDDDLPVAIAQDITVELDENGLASIVPAIIDNGSTAEAGLESLSLDITEFDCSNLGPNTVTLTITDVNNDSDSTTATVTVEDNIDPLAKVLNITIELDANGEATITPGMIDNGSMDNCDIESYSLDVSMFDCDDLGANTVTLTVTDQSSNSDSATAIVTVEDVTAPTAVTQDITVQLDGFGNASITSAMIDNGSFDNCEIESYSLDVSSFTTSDLGENTVTLTVTDQSSNSDSATAIVTVEENDGTPNTLAFQEVFTGRGLVSGSVAFADVDGDNDQDVVLSGALRISATGISGPLFSDLFKNDGNGNFTQVLGGAPFMGLAYSSVSFRDLNNDNILDVISTGENITTGNNFDNFYTNDGTGRFSQVPGFAFTNLERKDFKFADLDGDSDDDLLIIGEDNNGIPRVKLFESQGSSFSPQSNNLPNVLFGSIAVGDVNGDNLTDIFISGQLTNGTKIAEIYINNGNFQFSLLPATSFEGLDKGDSSFADVDNDGDQDLLISGQNSNMDNILKLYLNDGTGSFTEAVGIINLSSNIFMQAFEFADVDGDSDLDVLMTGYNTSNYRITLKIWENLLVSPVAPRSDENTSSNFSVRFIESNTVFGDDFRLYPNPVDNGYFDIHAPNLEGEISIVISDAKGRIVLSQNNIVKDNHVKVYTKDILGGLYIVTIKKGNESFITKVIVK